MSESEQHTINTSGDMWYFKPEPSIEELGKVMEQAQANIEAFSRIMDYLDEKGVEYEHGNPEYSITKCSLHVKNVPKQFYHSVLVPGMLEACHKAKVRFCVEGYVKDEDLRSLKATLRRD